MSGNGIVDLLLATSLTDPTRHLLRSSSGESWSYGDLSIRSGQFGQALQVRGVQPDDRIMVQVEKSPDALALHLAILRIGAVYIPLNPAYTATELQSLVDDAEPALLICETELGLSCPEIAMSALHREARAMNGKCTDIERSLDAPAVMLYTSGTTGRPKGAVMSQGNIISAVTTLTEAWGFTRADVLLHALPLFHTHGLFVAAYCTITTGASMILLEKFSPAVVIEELPNASVLMGVPTHYSRLLSDSTFTRQVTDHVRLFTSGSAPMLLSTHLEFELRTGATILERYGMTETCMLTSNPLLGTRKPGTVGLPLPGVELRIVEGSPGSIEVRGPNVFAGYWRRPDLRHSEFTVDGWFKTGDIGEFDEDGYLEIVGRSKDLVITGGLNVYPKEVEQALDALPGVLESAVFGLPDADFGEAVTAAVVLLPGANVQPEELRQQVRAFLAAFKVPKSICILSALPRNAMGKVEKARLRAEFAKSSLAIFDVSAE